MFKAGKLMQAVLICAGRSITIAAMLAAVVLLTGCESRPPLELVTEEEASQPVTRGSFEQQDNGPDIRILAPLGGSTVQSPFPIHIEFISAGATAAVNMASLKLTYMKLWGIDITDRVRDYISGTTLSVPETDIPAGRHTIEIYIEDSNKNVSSRQITINVE